MLHTNFTSNGVRYQLVTVGISRHEREALAESLRPDTSLWTSAAKKKLTNGIKDAKIPKAHKDRSHYAKPKPEDFL
jgi:hypothetical protein